MMNFSLLISQSHLNRKELY